MNQDSIFISLLIVIASSALLVVSILVIKIKQLSGSNKKLTKQLTESQSQHAAAQQAKSHAESANQAKDRYLSGISHELRTPLNVIMGYAQLLENQAEVDDPRFRSYQLMRQNCQHLSHLIEGILEFSAIEAGKLRVQSDVVNLQQIMLQMEQMFHNQAAQKNLKFTFEGMDSLPQYVKTDGKRLQQILINLLSNAIKFTHQGRVTMTVKYRHQIATFCITDTGVGIKDQDLEKIFQPFERIESSKHKTTGTGLGLTITKLLAELLGGELTVSSKAGEGSQFVFKVLLSSQNNQENQHAKEIIPGSSNHQTILLIDDEIEHRILYKNIMQPLGFEVLEASDCASAQQIIQANHIDLALLDVSMPGKDGWYLAEWIRSSGYDFSIIMLSANPRDNDPQRHKHHQAYLSKPVNINQLLTHINQLLKLGWSQTQHSNNDETPTNQQHKVHLKHKHKTAMIELLEIGHINGLKEFAFELKSQNEISNHECQLLLDALNRLDLMTFSKLISHE